ncbi:MAG: class A beta-lactamase, subclass A2 [Bacteroidota bacterium]
MSRSKNIRSAALFVAFLVWIPSSVTSAQNDPLRMKIEQIVAHANGTVGVAVLALENNDSLSVNGDVPFPMQSVYKFPVGLAVLDLVDKGVFALDQRIFIKKSDLLPKTWSPLREKYPNGDTAVALSEILKFTVAQSDNNGCDLLFRLVGGPEKVGNFIHSLGVKDIAVKNTEEEMGKDKQLQFRNFSTPKALAALFSLVHRGKALSVKNTQHIVRILEETSTGPKRLKGQLPAGTIVAHKTGSSGTDEQGITAATNDGGVITLPDGTHVAVVVFVSNSSADEKERENVISSIAKAVWDDYRSR